MPRTGKSEKTESTLVVASLGEGATVYGYRISFWGEKYFLGTVVLVAQHREYTKKQTNKSTMQ